MASNSVMRAYAGDDKTAPVTIADVAYPVVSTAKEVGVPGVYDYGPQRSAWMASLVTNWMGDAGFLLPDADTQTAAALVRMLSLDSGLRERVIAGQRRRAFHFRTENTARLWLKTLHAAHTAH